MTQIPKDCESFFGFDMTDEEVGEGEFRLIAIELKHTFESLYLEADKVDEELFLSADLIRCLTDFLKAPQSYYLARVLVVSPTLYEEVLEITRLVAPSQLNNIPVVIG